LHQRLQKYAEFIELPIGWIAKPGEDLDAVSWLPFKVVADVIDNNCLAKIPSNFAQVFDINAVIELTVVSIQPMRDIIMTLLRSGLVNIVENKVSVIFDSCREDDDFVKLRHILEELDTAGS